MKEVWKPVVGLENRYEVSNFGECRSIDRLIIDRRGRKMHLKGRQIKPYLGEYVEYVLKHPDGKQHLHTGHRMVAEAFIPNPDNLPCVNHKDENKYNNSVDNLEWCSYSYNARYNGNSKRIGMKMKGRLPHNCIAVIDVESGVSYPSISEASRRTGVSSAAVFRSLIRSGGRFRKAKILN